MYSTPIGSRCILHVSASMHSTRTLFDALYIHHDACTLHPLRGLCILHALPSVYSTCIEVGVFYMDHDPHRSSRDSRDLRNSRSSGSLACRGVHVARAMGGALAPSYAYGTHDQQSTMTLTPRLLDSVLPGERRASSRRSSYAHSLCCAPCLSTL